MKQSISMQKYAYFSNERPIAIDKVLSDNGLYEMERNSIVVKENEKLFMK